MRGAIVSGPPLDLRPRPLEAKKIPHYLQFSGGKDLDSSDQRGAGTQTQPPETISATNLQTKFDEDMNPSPSRDDGTKEPI